MKDFLYWQFVILVTFANFFTIYLSKITKKVPVYLKTWSGAYFKVFNLNSNLATIIEVWFDQVYKFPVDLLEKANPVVIDIGANIGAFSVFAWLKLKEPTIFAYEPEKNNFQLLAENVKLNNLTEVKIFKQAVYGQKGKRDLFLAGDSSGKNSIELKQSYGVSQEIDCITLEDIFKDNKIVKCDYLKIDCEGSEYELLLNTPKEVFYSITRIVLEYHQVDRFTSDDLINLFLSVGYFIEVFDRQKGMIVVYRP